MLISNDFQRQLPMADREIGLICSNWRRPIVLLYCLETAMSPQAILANPPLLLLLTNSRSMHLFLYRCLSMEVVTPKSIEIWAPGLIPIQAIPGVQLSILPDTPRWRRQAWEWRFIPPRPYSGCAIPSPDRDYSRHNHADQRSPREIFWTQTYRSRGTFVRLYSSSSFGPIISERR